MKKPDDKTDALTFKWKSDATCNTIKLQLSQHIIFVFVGLSKKSSFETPYVLVYM